MFLQSVLSGYNGTVMAYGQTGTGKTFTLGRLGKNDAAERGIMVRSLEDIMDNISIAFDTVEVTYLQVIFDITFFCDFVLFVHRHLCHGYRLFTIDACFPPQPLLVYWFELNVSLDALLSP